MGEAAWVNAGAHSAVLLRRLPAHGSSEPTRGGLRAARPPKRDASTRSVRAAMPGWRARAKETLVFYSIPPLHGSGQARAQRRSLPRQEPAGPRRASRGPRGLPA
ncbi:hypothetical protein MRX96_014343 [Rhipicephalus microplus]